MTDVLKEIVRDNVSLPGLVQDTLQKIAAPGIRDAVQKTLGDWAAAIIDQALPIAKAEINGRVSRFWSELLATKGMPVAGDLPEGTPV